jgi:molybdenum cofactor cytidylyltransferase
MPPGTPRLFRRCFGHMTEADQDIGVWGIIPAAGMGRRMGGPKQSLAYRGSTMAGTVTGTLLAANVSGVVVVTRTELIDALQLPAKPQVHVAINDDADSEMIDSIRIGLSALAPLQPGKDDGVLVVPADMPALSVDSCRACMAAYCTDTRRIVVAAHGGRRGHPIIFPYAMKDTVDNLGGGLNMLLDECSGHLFLVDTIDPGVTTDVDTAGDYERL